MTSSNNYGLNNDFDYYEYEFDSKDARNTLFPPPTVLNSNEIDILNWPLFTMGRPNYSIAAMKILEVQIPFSYYVITALNGTFILGEGYTANLTAQTYAFALPHTITIPPGNYNATALAPVLEGLFNAVTSYTPDVGFTSVYQVQYDSFTGRFQIFQHTTTPTANFALAFGIGYLDPGFTNPRHVLGFYGGALNNLSGPIPVITPPYPTGPGSNQYLASAKIAQTTGPNYLFINSNKIGQLAKLYLPEGAFGEGQIGPQLAKIPVNVNPGGVIFWQNPDPQKWFNVEALATFYDIDFYCTLGNSPDKIDFNGASFSLKLGILANRTERVDVKSGLTSEGRITKRVRPN
jgi:hypothetical protein